MIKVKKNNKKNHYIDNEKFIIEIRKYKDSCKLAIQENKEKPRIPEYIGSCLLKIAENYFNKPRFINYTYRDDMISEAVLICVKYFDSFNEEKSNPFAYFTKVVHNAFFQFLNNEEKNKYKTLKYFSQTILVGNEDEFINNGILSSTELYDNMYSFMETYEIREKLKKEKKKVTNLNKIMRNKNDTKEKDKQ